MFKDLEGANGVVGAGHPRGEVLYTIKLDS
jgi:hypothetical protein